MCKITLGSYSEESRILIILNSLASMVNNLSKTAKLMHKENLCDKHILTIEHDVHYMIVLLVDLMKLLEERYDELPEDIKQYLNEKELERNEVLSGSTQVLETFRQTEVLLLSQKERASKMYDTLLENLFKVFVTH